MSRSHTHTLSARTLSARPLSTHALSARARRSGRALAALLLCGLSTAAIAQSADSAANDGDVVMTDLRVEQAITVIGASQNVDDAAGSVAVLSRADLQQSQSVTVADALTRLPGVSVTRNGSAGSFTSLRIRGADAAQTLVIIDGVRVGDPSSPGGGFDFANLLSVDVSRVEMLRGSNSIAWGSDAIGGVVLVDTHSGGTDGLHGSALGEIGTKDSQQAAGTLSFGGRGVTLAGGASHTHTGGVSSAAVGEETDGFTRTGAHAAATVDLTDQFSAFASLHYGRARIALDGFAPPTYAFGDTAEYQKTRELYAGGGLAYRGGSLSARASFSRADIHRDSFDPAHGSAATFVARGRSNQWRLVADWRASDAARIVLGGDYETSRMATSSAFSADRQATHTGGVFANALVTPLAGLTLGAGIRHQQHRDFGGASVWSGNAVWHPGEGALALRASYFEGYKAPTLFQLSGDPGAYGNPALAPERSRSLEIGLATPLLGIAHLDVALYRRDSRNLIDFVACSGTGQPAICASGNRFFGTYANIARARAEGVEVSLTANPVQALTLTANYAYTATRNRTPGSASLGNRLARRPLHSALLAADVDAGSGTSFGAEIRYVGVSYDDVGNSTRLSDYALVSLRAAITLSSTLQLYGRVENLFDERYQTADGYGTAGHTVSVGIRARF